ncbi:MAG TPA: hypothetical protein DIT96_05120 [Pseudomonas sp.]|nr:hypothetical protein [Pseudomonas sp.]
MVRSPGAYLGQLQTNVFICDACQITTFSIPTPLEIFLQRRSSIFEDKKIYTVSLAPPRQDLTTVVMALLFGFDFEVFQP